MKKSLLTIALLSSLFTVACTQQEAKKETKNEPATATAPATPENATPPAMPTDMANAPVYVGVYQGVLPCADCGGIETTVELKADGSYVVTEKYRKEGEQPKLTSGQATFDQATSIITLENSDPANVRKFKVEGDMISQLDADGKKVESKSKDVGYDLKKAPMPPKDGKPMMEPPKDGQPMPPAPPHDGKPMDAKDAPQPADAKAEEKK